MSLEMRIGFTCLELENTVKYDSVIQYQTFTRFRNHHTTLTLKYSEIQYTKTVYKIDTIFTSLGEI